MKKFAKILVLGLLFAVSFSANAQYSSSPNAYGSPTRWNLYNKGLDSQSQLVTYPYANSHYDPILNTSKEVTSAHNYTLTGKRFVINAATNKDTIVLNPSVYTAGQSFNIINTNSGNDTTYIIATSPSRIDSVSSKVWGLAPYRAREIWFDGSYFWSISQQ